MSSLNPSHLLISRNPPRSPAHPQLAPTLSSRHSPSASLPPNLNSWTGAAGSNTGDLPTRSATASGFRSSTTLGTLDTNDNTAYREDEQIQIHPTFRADAPLPGRVKIIIGRNEFWCHKEVLWFASPFFQGLLEGNWAETNPGRPPLVTVIPGAASRRDSWTTSSPTDTDVAALPGVPELSKDKSHADNDDADDTALDITDEDVDEEGHSSSSGGKKESIYLDAAEDGPSMAQILRELRDLPEVPTAAPQPYDNDLFEERDTSSAVLDPASIVINETTQGQTIQGALDLPSFWPTTQSTLPPTLADRLSEPHRERSSSAHTRSRRRSALRHSFSSSVRVSTRSIQRDLAAPGYQTVDAVVELHEESALAFQDFLFWAYPHLECKVLWSNVENLLALSLKLLTPALQKLCEQFLLTYASGRPVLALMLAEQYGNAELFKEASRFVLDQTTWCSEEMDCLDESTQLKLSQRRNWFLERLLKLGTIDVKREYTCRSDCPDPGKCQVQLEEKWRQAYATVCRYGPPQPSIAFRCLRQLDPFPTGPTLLASHPYCQRAAKSWATTLFDRMFETKTVLSPSNPGTEKYWLTISLV